MKLEELKKQAHELYDEYRALARANADHEALRSYNMNTDFANDFMVNEFYKDAGIEKKLDHIINMVEEFNKMTLKEYGFEFISLEYGYVRDERIDKLSK